MAMENIFNNPNLSLSDIEDIKNKINYLNIFASILQSCSKDCIDIIKFL